MAAHNSGDHMQLMLGKIALFSPFFKKMVSGSSFIFPDVVAYVCDYVSLFQTRVL